MARTGLTNLISQLRALTNATSSDMTIGAETYFSDDHLQMILDSTQQVWEGILLEPRPDYEDGTPNYFAYSIPTILLRAFEEGGSADSGWVLYTRAGTEVDLADYTPNYQSGTIVFDSDTDGASFRLSCRTYNLNRAASNIWLQKASFAYQNVNWESDNHRLEASQEFAHAVQMAEFYAAKAGAQTAHLVRTDEV